VYLIIISANQKSIKPVLFYLSGTVPFLFLLFFNAMVVNGVSLADFIIKFKDRSTVSGGGAGYLERVKESFLGLFVRYGLMSGRFYIVLLQAIIAFWGLFFYKKNKNIFRVSILQLSLFIITIVFYSGGGMEYMLHFLFAFSFINIALLINENISKYHFNKIFLVLITIFFLNNVLGVFLVEKADYKNPYSEVSKNIQPNIPKSSVVLSPIEFWLPCKESEFYNSNSIWSFKKYKKISDLLNSGNLDYIINTDGIAVSQTEENINAINKYISEKGHLIYSLQTNNLGKISIYKVK